MYVCMYVLFWLCWVFVAARGLSLVAVCRLFIAVASLVSAQALECGDFPCSSVGEDSACSAGDLGSVLGSGTSPGVGNGNPLQYSCLENTTDRGAWQALHRSQRVEQQLKRVTHTPYIEHTYQDSEIGTFRRGQFFLIRFKCVWWGVA